MIKLVLVALLALGVFGQAFAISPLETNVVFANSPETIAKIGAVLHPSDAVIVDEPKYVTGVMSGQNIGVTDTVYLTPK